MLKLLTITDERSLIGHYKSQGLKDSDAIYSEKQTILKIHKTKKMSNWVLFWMFFVVYLIMSLLIGNFLTLLIVTAPVMVFIYTRVRKNKKMIEMINSATENYCKEIGVPAA
ncbi:hypothetical protein [Stutzerimonas kirkiae]|uniref:hypothetical protein n=1 Tax=Stutzerimonas kirkiae TaxID=2211392 RepID=UPI00103853CF|nr:hypothetical protein [Stutzerimonas kirkiae]TBV11345.1 hypothetical protein DNK08_03585 [Stutzerimonas kirkiae]